MLSASILDHELRGAPELARPFVSAAFASLQLPLELEPAEEDEGLEAERAPGPGSGLLVGGARRPTQDGSAIRRK
jgi:hypothetical protein